MNNEKTGLGKACGFIALCILSIPILIQCGFIFGIVGIFFNILVSIFPVLLVMIMFSLPTLVIGSMVMITTKIIF